MHGQRSLAGYSPWGHKESGMTEQLSMRVQTHTHTHTHTHRFHCLKSLMPNISFYPLATSWLHGFSSERDNSLLAHLTELCLSAASHPVHC